MSELIIDMDKWDIIDGVYTYPLTPQRNNWYDIGLIAANDYTADLFGWYGFSFTAQIHGLEEITVKVGLLDFGEVNTEETIDYYTWKATVWGNGETKITAPLEQFDLISSMPAKWRFLRSVEINHPVKDLKALKGKSVYAHAHVKSKSAEPGEVIDYKLTVINCVDSKQSVSFEFEKDGWEVLSPYMTEEYIVLEPFEEKVCHIRVTMSERIVPGGYEKHRIHVVPNGDGSLGQVLEFMSVRHLAHPYISNTEKEWDRVKEKITKYEWAKKLADDYIAEAYNWNVPEAGNVNHGMFESKESEHCFGSALAWKLTGDISLAEKSALFLRRLSEPKTGYPLRRKGASQQLVHEGEFFKYCAFTYDLIHDCGVLSEEDHKNIHTTFRLFIDFLDWALCDGGISNWSLAENAGALYCSMALQDREKIERFTYGIGGVTEHLRAGVFSDGWWCECTIGYNQMCAGLFSEMALALRPWGINISNMWVRANYSKQVHFRNKHADGLCWDIYGKNSKNYRCIEDLWDSLVAVANYRSVTQGINDSAEEVSEGASRMSFDSRYDIGYAIYKKPEYAQIIRNCGEECRRDLLHGEGELPVCDSDVHRRSCYFDNGGIAILRTNTPGREDSEQIEVGVKYGTHGGAHGHYDRTALNAISRYGKALYNPENVWYSYGTFMYKFFVQNSITHNMVTTDLKLQDPTEGKQNLFHSGEVFNASVVENCAKWSNPPYGGWKVRNEEPTFKERAWVEGRYVNIPENTPPYSKRTDFTEPIMQRRAVVLTDDYVVCFDYVRGECEHDYHCIYHFNGLKNTECAKLKRISSAQQLTDDYLSSAQFITEAETFEKEGTVRLSFEYEYGEGESGKASWLGRPFRSGHNVPGKLKTDLYYVGNGTSELIVACDPEYYAVSKRLFYSVKADGETIAKGKFGAWIFGRDHIEADVANKKEVTLHVYTEDGTIDHAKTVETVKTVFWGDPYFETANGKRIYLADMEYSTDNVDSGNGVGVDYGGGVVKLQTKVFEKAVPGDVIDKSREGVITVDISRINAVRFVSDIGGDYPVGDESARRRFIAEKKHAESARFISVTEAYRDKRMIENISCIGDDEIAVKLSDGREQKIKINNLDTGTDISIEVEESVNGVPTRCEEAK